MFDQTARVVYVQHSEAQNDVACMSDIARIRIFDEEAGFLGLLTSVTSSWHVPAGETQNDFPKRLPGHNGRTRSSSAWKPLYQFTKPLTNLTVFALRPINA